MEKKNLLMVILGAVCAIAGMVTGIAALVHHKKKKNKHNTELDIEEDCEGFDEFDIEEFANSLKKELEED